MADRDIVHAALARAGVQVEVYTEASSPALSTADRFLVENNGKMSVFVEAGSTPTMVRVEIPHTIDGQVVSPRTVEVAANSLVGIGDWPTDIYNDANARVALSFTSVDGVKLFCACLR